MVNQNELIIIILYKKHESNRIDNSKFIKEIIHINSSLKEIGFYV